METCVAKPATFVALGSDAKAKIWPNIQATTVLVIIQKDTWMQFRWQEGPELITYYTRNHWHVLIYSDL